MFALILCFQSFGSVGVSAADSENLIESDLTEWNNMFPELTDIYSAGNAYFILSKSSELSTGDFVKASYLYSLSNLTSGRSYSFKFHLLNFEEVTALKPSLLERNIYGGLQNGGTYVIGLASYIDDNNLELVDDCYITIDINNYLNYFGKDSVITFELPNIVNPCLLISYREVSSNKYTQYTFFKDISLVDNEQQKEDNFLSRLFEWFQEKFDAIGESFTNLGNKLTELKDGFINKITELKTSFENKINDLKESFQAKIDELKQGLIDLKDSLIEGIKSLFVPDEEVILGWKQDLDNLLKEHLGIIYTCSELFTDTLNLAFDIVFEAPNTYEIKIPEVSFEAAGTTVPVFSAQYIDFSFMEKPVFKTMYGMYTVALYFFFGALEVKYALRVYRKVMSN